MRTLVILLAMLGCNTKHDTHELLPIESYISTPKRPSCGLTVPETELDPIVFPTFDGAKLFSETAGASAATVCAEHDGFEVPRFTTCAQLDLLGGYGEPYYAKVVILDGDFAGRVGWVPAEYTTGR